MTLLDSIDGPDDVKALDPSQLDQLAQEIRDFLVTSVSQTGGHLGPNLGVVELSIALHRVFDSPQDTIVFDTGHQSYVHKLLTGRHDFDRLRMKGGLSGYPSRAESEHDVVENSHASTALSWADGIAKARRLTGRRDRHTVAVVGDGALTGGMAWEAINNIAVDKDLPLVIVVNDNERSYAPTTGGLADHLATLRTTRKYESVLGWGKDTLNRTPVVGGVVYGALHGVKKGIKDFVAPQGMFEDLGLKYLGPIDGHDEPSVEAALRRAKSFEGPVLVHVLTTKGKGYDHARNDDADRFHAVDRINPETGLPLQVKGRIWTDEFSDALLGVARERDDVVAITAAMLIPTGLKEFAERLPRPGLRRRDRRAARGHHGVRSRLRRAAPGRLRVCDVPQPRVRPAAHGLRAAPGRGDVRPGPGGDHGHRRGVAQRHVGHVGDRLVPGLRLCAPRDAEELGRALREAVDVADGPTVIRFSKQNPPGALPAVRTVGSVDVLAEPSTDDAVELLLVGLGEMATTAMAVSEKLSAQGHTVRVVDPRWCVPVSRRPRRDGPGRRRRRGARGQPGRRGSRLPGLGGAARGGALGPGPSARHPEAVPVARLARRAARGDRPHPRRRGRPPARRPDLT